MTKTAFPVLLVFLLCGVLAFADSTPVTAIHNYSPAGSLSDALGGPYLYTYGGTTLSDGTYVFGKDQGLSLTGALPSGSFSIEMVFALNSVSGWNKLIDFSGLTADRGLYVANGNIALYSSGGTSTAVVGAGQQEDLILTKDSSNNVVIYLNNVAILSVNDFSGATSGSNLNFFMDDSATGGAEATSGSVTRISIFDHALNQSEVNYTDADGGCINGSLCGSSAPAAVPEPSALLLLATGLSSAGIFGKRFLK